MRKILAAVLAAAIALSGTVFASGEEEKTYRLLNGLIKSIEVEGGSDSPEKMIDGHYDSSFRMYKPPMTTDIFIDFGDNFVTVEKIAVAVLGGLTGGITKVDLDWFDGSEYRPLRRGISLSWTLSDASSEKRTIPCDGVFTDKIRIRVLEANKQNGYWEINELMVYGHDKGTDVKSVPEQSVTVKRGEKLVLPETVGVVLKNGKETQQSVEWENKTPDTFTAGKFSVYGEIPGSSIKAVYNVEVMGGESHWADSAISAMAKRNAYDFDSSDPDSAVTRNRLADAVYNYLALEHDYMPDRVKWTKEQVFTDVSQESELYDQINSAADAGVFEGFGISDTFDGEKTVTRLEAAHALLNIYNYHGSEVKPSETEHSFKDTDDSAVKTVCGLGIISAGEYYRPNDIITEAELCTMLDRMTGVLQQCRVYPVPDGVDKLYDYKITVNGEPLETYKTYAFPGNNIQTTTVIGRPATEVSVAYFDFFGEAEIEIEACGGEFAIGDTPIRPLSEGIVPTINGNKIKFTLNKPCNLSVEPFGTEHPLHLFANPIDKNLPDFDDPNVTYFGPGVHYIDPIYLKDNETLYLDGGAVLYVNRQEKDEGLHTVYGYQLTFIDAAFMADKKDTTYDTKMDNITIRGRGIVSGNKTLEKFQRHKLIQLYGVKNSSVDGIILLESSGWNFFIAQSDGVYVNNIKMVGHYANNDGIDACDSVNLYIQNSFAHNADDSFLVKSWYPVDNVTFKNCVVWNDVSTSLGAVCEINRPVTNVLYKDCTVIHSSNPLWTANSGGVVGIWDAEGGDIDNFVFENTVIEDCVAGKEPIKVNLHSHGVEFHDDYEVKNITFKNFKILDTRENTVAIVGPREHGIHDVTFENLEINGEKVLSVDDRFVIQNADNVTVK